MAAPPSTISPVVTTSTPHRIGLLGHSEGGLYAAMLAAKDPASPSSSA